jgi:hypothetical protein
MQVAVPNTCPSSVLAQRLRDPALFAVGSLLFALGAVPGYASAVGARWDAVTFFIGSLFCWPVNRPPRQRAGHDDRGGCRHPEDPPPGGVRVMQGLRPGGVGHQAPAS